MLPAQTLRPVHQDGRLAKGPLGTESQKEDWTQWLISALDEKKKKKSEKVCNTDELICHSQAQNGKKRKDEVNI